MPYNMSRARHSRNRSNSPLDTSDEEQLQRLLRRRERDHRSEHGRSTDVPNALPSITPYPPSSLTPDYSNPARENVRHRFESTGIPAAPPPERLVAPSEAGTVGVGRPYLYERGNSFRRDSSLDRASARTTRIDAYEPRLRDHARPSPYSIEPVVVPAEPPTGFVPARHQHYRGPTFSRVNSLPSNAEWLRAPSEYDRYTERDIASYPLVRAASRSRTDDWDTLSRPFSHFMRDDDDNDTLLLDDYSDYEFELGASLKSSLFANANSSGTLSQTSDIKRENSKASSPKPGIVQSSPDHQAIIYQIHDSKLTGHAQESSACADLVVECIDATGVHKKSHDIFRWVHVQSQVMNFQAFEDYVLQSNLVSADDVKRLKALLSRVRHRLEHTIPQGTNGKYLQASLLQDVGKKSNKAKNQKPQSDIVFLSFPFFCVDSYSEIRLPEKSTAHPMRSILQHKYPSIKKDRDMLQAACRLGSLPKGYCFNVSQLWCIVIGDDTLITCSRDGLTELGGQSVHITGKHSAPIRASGVQALGRTGLHVSDGMGRVWILESDQCTTWFEFTALFVSIERDAFEDTFDVLYKQAPITANDWPGIIRDARRSLLRLTLRRKPLKDELDSSASDATSVTSSDSEFVESEDSVFGDDSELSSISSSSSGSDRPINRRCDSRDDSRTRARETASRNNREVLPSYPDRSDRRMAPEYLAARTHGVVRAEISPERSLPTPAMPQRSALKKTQILGQVAAQMALGAAASRRASRLATDAETDRVVHKDVRFQRADSDSAEDINFGRVRSDSPPSPPRTSNRRRTSMVESASDNDDDEHSRLRGDTVRRPSLDSSSNESDARSPHRRDRHIEAYTSSIRQLLREPETSWRQTRDPWITEEQDIARQLARSLSRWTILESHAVRPPRARNALRLLHTRHYFQSGCCTIAHSSNDQEIRDFVQHLHDGEFSDAHKKGALADPRDSEFVDLYDYVVINPGTTIGVRFQRERQQVDQQLIPYGARVYITNYCGRRSWVADSTVSSTIVVKLRTGSAYEQDFEILPRPCASQLSMQDTKESNGTLIYSHKETGKVQIRDHHSSTLLQLMQFLRACDKYESKASRIRSSNEARWRLPLKDRRAGEPSQSRDTVVAKARHPEPPYDAEKKLQPVLVQKSHGFVWNDDWSGSSDEETVRDRAAIAQAFGESSGQTPGRDRVRSRSPPRERARATRFYSDGRNAPIDIDDREMSGHARDRHDRKKPQRHRKTSPPNRSTSSATTVKPHRMQLLAWLSGLDCAIDPGSFSIDHRQIQESSPDKLEAICSEAHKFLCDKGSTSDKKRYMRCARASREQVIGQLLNIRDRRTRIIGPSSIWKLKVVTLARRIFNCFIDVDSRSVIMAKCNGMMITFLRARETGLSPPTMKRTLLLLKEILRIAEDICTQLHSEQAPHPWPTAAREAAAPSLIRAWVTFVRAQMSLAATADQPSHADTSHRSQRGVSKHLERTLSLLKASLADIRRSCCQITLEENAAVLPFGIVSLLTGRLQRDVTWNDTDIMTTYWTYFDKLDMEVRLDPLPRSHQEKISHLTQEIGAIVPVLEDQLKVLEQLASVGLPEGSYSARYRSISAARSPLAALSFSVGREAAVIGQSIHLIRARLESLRELQVYTSELSSWSTRMIESNKDRQEAAILAFSVVTVIFLPLSFVSSLFGMNTSDVRDMGQSQWLYWAVALPFTIMIALLTLAWVGELDPLIRLLSRLKLSRKKRKLL